MIANQTDKNDVAIHWRRRTKALAEIRRSGECPSHAVPRRLRPGGLVALVASDGEVLLLFRLARITEHVSVLGADGKRYRKGCLLIARRGTVRKPQGRDPKYLSVNQHAVGAFAYFDAATYQRVIYELDGGDDEANSRPFSNRHPFPTRRLSFFANNIGKTLSQPERQLILAYVNWVGDIELFAHHGLKESGLYTDLFVPRCWTLFEAKASGPSSSRGPTL